MVVHNVTRSTPRTTLWRKSSTDFSKVLDLEILYLFCYLLEYPVLHIWLKRLIPFLYTFSFFNPFSFTFDNWDPFWPYFRPVSQSSQYVWTILQLKRNANRIETQNNTKITFMAEFAQTLFILFANIHVRLK